MKALTNLYTKNLTTLNRFLLALFFMAGGSLLFAQNNTYLEFIGQVTDATSGKPIPEVHLSVENTNISGLGNNNGVFTLKIPTELEGSIVRFFKLNYEPRSVLLSSFSKDFTDITLTPNVLKIEELDEVEVYRASNARIIVENLLKKRTPISGKLVGFYREKIDKGRHNVMLGEAVVQVDQEKTIHGKKGEISIYKSRKRTDYKRLDTLAVKLRGGPYSAGIYMDLATYPELLFHPSKLDGFEFNLGEPTAIDNRYIYVIHFEQIDKEYPWYYGKMYIDAKSNALVKVNFNLNVEDKKTASRMLVAQKPRRAKVTPLEVKYQAEYIEKDGQWYYNYGEFFMDLRVNWKGKLFNSRYAVHTEMAITDRSPKAFFPKKSLTRIKPSVIMIDDITGFGDPEFWGANNTIHPDKKLQEVMEAIQDKIKKEK